MKQTHWNGTEGELYELVDVLARNCACNTSNGDATPGRCHAHAMLFDQRVVNGLLFARRIVQRLLVEEYALPRSAAC